jgi:two-component system cell cycle sensor histidine kinase/response regulator CckA
MVLCNKTQKQDFYHRGILLSRQNQDGKTTILVVDDEDVILNLVMNILSRQGFDVLMAKSGNQACEIFEQGKDRIDLVILDMIMPGMGGEETYEKLKSFSPQMRVIISSGYGKVDSPIEVSPEKKTGFVQKPYNIDMLVNEVNRVLAF